MEVEAEEEFHDVGEAEAQEVNQRNASPSTSTEAQYGNTSSDDEEVNSRDYGALVKLFSQKIHPIMFKIFKVLIKLFKYLELFL